MNTQSFKSVSIFFSLVILFTTITMILSYRHATQLIYTDIMEVDNIALYSDGEELVIYNFREDYILFGYYTVLNGTQYYYVPSDQDPVEYINSSILPLDKFTNYYDFIESKWAGKLSLEEFNLTILEVRYANLSIK